jgi:hypothetical protein
MTQFNETILKAMVELEGYTFEEAKLSYAQREKLPDSAFCGPNRTYPAQDAAHVRNGLARLGTFGHRLSPATRASILRCLKARAKRYEIEVGETIEGKIALAKFDDELDEKTRTKWLKEIEETRQWYEETITKK